MYFLIGMKTALLHQHSFHNAIVETDLVWLLIYDFVLQASCALYQYQDTTLLI